MKCQEHSVSQPLVLASASPRRLELLSLLGVPFEVIPSQAEENDVSGSGRERVRVLARRKGEEVFARLPGTGRSGRRYAGLCGKRGAGETCG